MKSFDLLLVLGYFRSATAYLSVIRYLSPRLRIGVFVADVDPAHLAKTPAAQARFLELCSRFGADIVRQGTAVETRLMVVQQFPYPRHTIETINATVQAQRRVALLGLTFAGLPAQDAVLPAFRIRKAWVPNLRLFHFLAERRNAQDAYRDIEVEQVGLPFKQYPIFPDFTADYVIAAPTTFSFRAEADKHRFLQDVLRLLDQIPASATVLYKSHNGAARDYFSPPSYTAGARVTRRWPGVGKLVPAIAQRSPGGFRRHLDRLHTAILHTTLLDRVIPMSEASPDADMSLEAFLPHVTKGVIGGLSNTIWGTLYFGLPFYNCVDSLTRSQSKKELLVHKDPSNFLELNLQFFQVPYCHGNLGSGSYGRDIVKEEDRKGDLLSAILGELERPVLVSRLEESPAGVVR